MRFVSRSGEFHAGNFRNAELAISEPKVVVVGGQSRAVQSEPYVVAEALPIKFSQTGLLKSDIDAAIEHFKNFPGLPLEEDGVTPANPVECGRIGVWDSVEWQSKYRLEDGAREEAENLLLRSPFYGEDFVKVETPADVVSKPWASYDETHHFKIPTLAAELDLVPEALAYEQANKAREGVIKALEEKLPAAEDVTGEVVTA